MEKPTNTLEDIAPRLSKHFGKSNYNEPMLIVCLGYAPEYSLGRVNNRCLFSIVQKVRNFEVKVSESTFHPQVSPFDLPPSLCVFRENR